MFHADSKEHIPSTMQETACLTYRRRFGENYREATSAAMLSGVLIQRETGLLGVFPCFFGVSQEVFVPRFG
jgi:hypothetical protein